MTACRNVITEPKISNGQSQKSRSKQSAYWPGFVRVSRDVDHRHSCVSQNDEFICTLKRNKAD